MVIPGFTDEFLFKPEHSYISSFFHDRWIGALPGSPNIQMVTVSDTHALIMDDRPEKLDKLIDEFLKDQWKAFPALRRIFYCHSPYSYREHRLAPKGCLDENMDLTLKIETGCTTGCLSKGPQESYGPLENPSDRHKSWPTLGRGLEFF